MLLPFTTSPVALQLEVSATRDKTRGSMIWALSTRARTVRSSCPRLLWSCRSSLTAQVEQWPTGQGCCQRNPRKIRASPKPAPTCSQLPQMNKHFGTSGGREVLSDLTWAVLLLGELLLPWPSFEENLKSHFNLLHYYLFKLILLSHQDLLQLCLKTYRGWEYLPQDTNCSLSSKVSIHDEVQKLTESPWRPYNPPRIKTESKNISHFTCPDFHISLVLSTCLSTFCLLH